MSLENKLKDFLKDYDDGFIPIRELAKSLDVVPEILDKKIVEIKSEFGKEIKRIGFKMPFLTDDKKKDFYQKNIVNLGFLLYKIKEVFDYENRPPNKMALKFQIETWEKFRGY